MPQFTELSKIQIDLIRAYAYKLEPQAPLRSAMLKVVFLWEQAKAIEQSQE